MVDLHLLARPNFAAANVMMLVLGMSLFGTTVLLPQYTQIYMGYTAQLAGMTLSPGGITVILLLPMVGFLVSRVDQRFLIAFGFTCLSLSLFYMAHHLYQGMDFRTAMLMRIYQSAGLAFLFVPINTFRLRRVADGVKNNNSSGIINLFRNMGGDIGILIRDHLHRAPLASAPGHAGGAHLAAQPGLAGPRRRDHQRPHPWQPRTRVGGHVAVLGGPAGGWRRSTWQRCSRRRPRWPTWTC